MKKKRKVIKMKSKEVLEQLYNEREYLLGDKVAHKTSSWCEDIKHYDNIKECLIAIAKDLEILEILKKHIKVYDCRKLGLNDFGIMPKGKITEEELKLLKEWSYDK